MFRKHIITILFITVSALVAFSQDGGTRNNGQNARIVMDPVFKLKIKPKKTVKYKFETKEDYDNGIFDLEATQVEVEANMDWQVTITAGQEYFEGKNGNKLRPEVFHYAKTGEALQSLTYQGDPRPVATGGSGKKNVEGNTFYVDYFVDPGYETPDEYIMEIVYTISAK